MSLFSYFSEVIFYELLTNFIINVTRPPARTDNDFNLPVHNIFQGPTPMMIDNPNMNMMDEDGNYDGSDRRGTRPKLNINIPENTNTSANMVGAANKVHLVEKLQNLALGSPRFHRRKRECYINYLLI